MRYDNSIGLEAAAAPPTLLVPPERRLDCGCDKSAGKAAAIDASEGCGMESDGCGWIDGGSGCDGSGGRGCA